MEITPEVLRKVADTCNIIKCNPRELARDEVYEILMECMWQIKKGKGEDENERTEVCEIE